MNYAVITPKDYYVHGSLYYKYVFPEDKLNEIEKIGTYVETIDCMCIECGENSVFRAFIDLQEESNYNLTKLSRPKRKLTGFVNRKFFCTRNNLHVIHFSSIIDKNSIMKIGQYPSIADIAESEVKKFKSILGEYYQDLNKAIGLFSHGVGVGAYVYLRRIVENFIVHPAYELAKLEFGWDEKVYEKSRFKEKLTLLKPQLPKFLVDNSVLYSILSKGIHDMSEAECKKYFPVMKESIILILENMLAAKKRKERELEVSKALNTLSGQLE